MPNYTVNQGDCISSIAFRNGFFWEKIWNHPNNSELKQKRQDPNVLFPGDTVFIPEKEEKSERRATEQRHRFRLKGCPARLRLRILEEPTEQERRQNPPISSAAGDSRDSFTEDPEADQTPLEDRPRRNVPYVLEIDGNLIRGKTDSDGRIECAIPPGAQGGCLIIEPGTPNEATIPLHLGHLDPLSELSGVKQRLANLGFDCGDRDNTETPELGTALRVFQEKQGLPVTGEADQTTRDKLRELHGS